MKQLAVILVALSVAWPCLARPLPPLTVHDVGEYGAIPWEGRELPLQPGSRADRVRDLNLGVSSVNINQEGDIPARHLEHWAKLADQGAAQGMKFLPRVYFWDGEDRYQGPMRDIEVYWGRLDQFLGAMDVSDFYGIVLAEENVSYAGRPEVLTELYRRVKAKYDIAVWQWWSPTTAVPESGGWIPADGWVIDPYFLPTERFYRYLRKYIITGLPVVLMPAASTEFEMTPERWRLNDEQLEAAVEFNLPVAFYWVNGNTCYFAGDREATGTPLDQINQWVWRYIERVRALPADYNGLPSADHAEGQLREIGPVEGDLFVYADDFSTARCVDDAWMTGFRDLVLDGKALAARGLGGRQTSAELTYRFAGDFPVAFPQVQVDARVDAALHGRVEVALSTDGADWSRAAATDGKDQTLTLATAGDPRFASVTSFWARVRMAGDPGTRERPPCRVDNLRISGPLVPASEPVVRLRALADGTLAYSDDFTTRKYLYATIRKGDEKLEWAEGRICVRLQPGGAAPELVWHVVSDEALGGIKVEVTGRANRGSLGTNHALDVSLDGLTWECGVDTTKMPMDTNSWTDDPMVVDLSENPRYAQVREFYVRLRMTAQGYKELHPVQSGVVTGLKISAVNAEP